MIEYYEVNEETGKEHDKTMIELIHELGKSEKNLLDYLYSRKTCGESQYDDVIKRYHHCIIEKGHEGHHVCHCAYEWE